VTGATASACETWLGVGVWADSRGNSSIVGKSSLDSTWAIGSEVIAVDGCD
jgi:hypothetical protein